MNQVRRLAGLYEALNTAGTWRLGRQLPFDSANFIRAQHIHVALDPGHQTQIVDTLDVVVGTSYGLAVRLNNQARLDEVRLDGREVEHQLAGGVLWIAAPARKHARLALRYRIADEERTEPQLFEQSVDEYIGFLHSTSTLTRGQLGPRAEAFDAGVRGVFARRGIERLRYRVIGTVTWAVPR